jgi:outer membrane protein assembly factor BamC
MPIPSFMPASRIPAALTAVTLACSGLAGCSSVNNLLASDKVDYRSSGSAQAVKLEVPPDLTQLGGGSRYQLADGPVSASAQQAAQQNAAGASTTPAIAPQATGPVQLQRDGDQRWLLTSLPADQVWPVAKAFWLDQGFTLAIDQPEAGVLETDWSENRAKLPKDAVRNMLGGILNSLYDTGERDRFRTRIERTPQGTEIYISHRGVVENVTDAKGEQTAWQVRPTDAGLEAEMLSRLMVRLGATAQAAEAAKATATAGSPGVASAAAPTQAQAGEAGTVIVLDGFDRAWRRVGLALDRSGFTVEDRDRTQGLYFVRYVEPSRAARSEPGFLSRIFGSSKPATAPGQYRIKVAGQGAQSLVTVLDAQGQPVRGETGQRIANVLLEQLR